MERQKIKSPKTKRPIYINGDAYNQLKKEYTEEYLLSLPRINTKPVKNADITKNVAKSASIEAAKSTLYITNEVLFEIAQNLNYFNILNLCSTNKNYHKICEDQHFWKVKYDKDFKHYNESQYLKESEYNKKWFPKQVQTFEEYNRDKFEEASSNWKILYENEYYNKIKDLVNIIFHRFGIQEKYDNYYHARKSDIVKSIINYIKNRLHLTDDVKINMLNKKIVIEIKKLLSYHYKDFNYYANFFNEAPDDNDTADEFILKMVQKDL